MLLTEAICCISFHNAMIQFLKMSHTAGEISIEHVTIFLSKYISKGAVDMKSSADVGNNPSDPYIQRKQHK